MLLLLSFALAANAMYEPTHARSHHSQPLTEMRQSKVQYGKDDRGAHARSLTNKPSEYQRKQAERAEIEREESAARAAFAKQEQRAQEAQALYAANVQKAAEKLRKQRAFDARQEAEATDDKQARIDEEAAVWESKYAAEAAAVELSRLAQEAEQIERMRAMNAGVFGARELGIQRNQEEYNARYAEISARVEAARFMERRIQAEGARLRELTNEGASNLLGDRVQAATDAARWAPRFERMEEEAEQDELQKAYRDRRAQHKIAVAAGHAAAARAAEEAAQAAADKAETKRARQQFGRQRGAAYKRMCASMDALSAEVDVENEKPALRRAAEKALRYLRIFRNPNRAECPAYPEEFMQMPEEAY